MSSGWGERRLCGLRLLRHVRENEGGSPERGPPVDFELFSWLPEGVAGVFN